MTMQRPKRESEEDFDVDQEVLDRILNKLYDFGDGPDNKRSKKKQKTRKRLKEEEEEEEVSAEEENVKRLGCEKHSADARRVTEAATGTGGNRTPAWAADDSGGSERKEAEVEIVTFQDPRKKKKKKLKEAAEEETKPAEVKERKKKEADVLSIEKARLDVHRFGITGFQKQQQRVFEQDRAIMLGARPPKRNYVNYKVFQQTMKERKTKEKQEVKTETPKKKKKSSGRQKNVKRQSAAEPSGHMGRFKNGMLLLSSKDVHKLTSKVRK